MGTTVKEILIILFLCASGTVWADDSGLSLDEREAKFLKQINEDLAKATDPVEIARKSKESEAKLRERFKKPGAELGMTTEQVENDTYWGKPHRVNTTTTKYGINAYDEQCNLLTCLGLLKALPNLKTIINILLYLEYAIPDS